MTRSAAELVRQVQYGDEDALLALYALAAKSRLFLLGKLGPQDAPDLIQEIYLCAIAGIQRGELRKTDSIESWVTGIGRNLMKQRIGRLIRNRRDVSLDLAESQCDRRERQDARLLRMEAAGITAKIWGELKPCDRELLWRFYVDEQPKARICAEMKLTATQFRLGKNRAKAKFGVAVRAEWARLDARLRSERVA